MSSKSTKSDSAVFNASPENATIDMADKPASGNAHAGDEESPEQISRRKFLSRMSNTLVAAAAIPVAVPVVGFIIAPLFRESPQLWRGVGPVDRFKIGETIDVSFVDPSPLPWSGVTSQTAAWVRRVNQTDFIAFAVNCTHLGCPVNWLPSAKIFMCPCHGGVYYANGKVAAGPPPESLAQYKVRVNNGQVEILATGAPVARGSLE